MENESKALIIAGSILISVLIIGALMFMFSNLKELIKTEDKIEDSNKLLKYESLIEEFCRPGVYGSELISLANLIEDYNKRESDLKGYIEIKLEVTMKKISSAKYIKEHYNDYKELLKDFNLLEKEINTLKNKTICGETIEKLSGKRSLEIEMIVNNYNENFSKKYTLTEVEKQINDYLIIKSEYTTLKNKRFNNPSEERDKNNGRITKVTFSEKGI